MTLFRASSAHPLAPSPQAIRLRRSDGVVQVIGYHIAAAVERERRDKAFRIGLGLGVIAAVFIVLALSRI